MQFEKIHRSTLQKIEDTSFVFVFVLTTHMTSICEKKMLAEVRLILEEQEFLLNLINLWKKE